MQPAVDVVTLGGTALLRGLVEIAEGVNRNGINLPVQFVKSRYGEAMPSPKGQKVWKETCRAELHGVCLCTDDWLKRVALGPRQTISCGTCNMVWVTISVAKPIALVPTE